jgi:hypothetical protein
MENFSMDDVAVCFSGIIREPKEHHLQIIKRIKSILPYDTFFATWDNYDLPVGEECKTFPEPIYDYHNLFDVEQPPDQLLKRVTGPGGKYRPEGKPGAYEHTRGNSKQIICHSNLVKTLPSKYKIIIRMRYDAIISNSFYDDIQKYIRLVRDKDFSVGFRCDYKAKSFDEIEYMKEHKLHDCKYCSGYYLFDHLIIHKRKNLQNVDSLFENKKLIGAEWGWAQVLHNQWGNHNFVNVVGGFCLHRYTVENIAKEMFSIRSVNG